MSEFTISQLSDASVLALVDMKDSILIDPEYQRPGGVWSLDKKQLFIDSLINRYDIPKFYFHALAGEYATDDYKYAIIDGRQRLEAIWDFFEGRFPLSPDFKFLPNEEVRAGNMTYNQLSQDYPRLLTVLHSRTLSVMVVMADELDFIEDMFSRLNEAVPLNAAEKRNAFGGPLPPIIRDLAQHPFFGTKTKVPETRYRHHDLAAKMLYLEYEDEIVDTKKASLDYFVKGNKDKDQEYFHDCVVRMTNNLDALSEIFADSDPLLRSSGMIVVYYVLASKLRAETDALSFGRADLTAFEDRRRDNREKFEQEDDGIDFKLIEFDELAQSSNDGAAIKQRYEVLREYLGV